MLCNIVLSNTPRNYSGVYGLCNLLPVRLLLTLPGEHFFAWCCTCCAFMALGCGLQLLKEVSAERGAGGGEGEG